MTPTDSTPTIVPEAADAGDIVARGATYYRVTRYVMTAVLIGMGAWFAYDGFVKYPEHNRLRELHRQDPETYPQNYPHHNDAALKLQRGLGYLLPPLGVLMLGWTLYNSRGRYVLSGDTLSAPGHPPIPVAGIRRIDKSRWDRKGIAYLDYEVPGSRPGRIRLDDFIYERKPTDAILDRIEARLLPPAAAEAAATVPASSDIRES